jgi:hypothetical protein
MGICPNGGEGTPKAPNTYVSIDIEFFIETLNVEFSYAISQAIQLFLAPEITALKVFAKTVNGQQPEIGYAISQFFIYLHEINSAIAANDIKANFLIPTSVFCKISPPQNLESPTYDEVYGFLLGLSANTDILMYKLARIAYTNAWAINCKCKSELEIPTTYTPPNEPPACPKCYAREGKQYVIFANSSHKFVDPNDIFGEQYPQYPGSQNLHYNKLLPRDVRVEWWLKRFTNDQNWQTLVGIYYDYAFGGYFLGNNKDIKSTGTYIVVDTLTNQYGRNDPAIYHIPAVGEVRVFDVFTGQEMQQSNGDFNVPPCTFVAGSTNCPEIDIPPIIIIPKPTLGSDLLPCPVCQTVVEDTFNVQLPSDSDTFEPVSLTLKRLEPEETTPDNQMLLDLYKVHPEYFVGGCTPCPETEDVSVAVNEYDDSFSVFPDYETVTLVKED